MASNVPLPSKSHSTFVIVNSVGAVEVDVNVTAVPDCGLAGANVKDGVGAASADGAANAIRAAASTRVQQREVLDKGAGVQKDYVYLEVYQISRNSRAGLCPAAGSGRSVRGTCRLGSCSA